MVESGSAEKEKTGSLNSSYLSGKEKKQILHPAPHTEL